MFLKVDIDGEEQFFAFEGRDTITIGRAPESDIQLLTEGISRNHMVVTEEGGDFFVQDLGSTNGSFLNEERIEANTKTPFNSFFPIKLGFHVFLYLVDEASAQAMQEEVLRKQQEEEDKKRQELKEQRIQKTKAQSMSDRVYVPKSQGGEGTGQTKIIKRKKIAVKSTKAAPAKKGSGNLTFILLALVLGGGAFMYSKWRTGFKNLGQTPTVQVKPIKKIEPKKPVQTGLSVKDAKGVIVLDKCLGSLEAKLCGPLAKQRGRDYYEGFLKLAANLYLVVDIEKLVNEYKNSPLSEGEKEDLLNQLSRYLGRSFSRQKIIAADYRHEEVDTTSETAVKAAILTDIVQLKLAGDILASEDVSNFYVILYKGKKKSYVAHAKFGKKELEKIAGQEELPSNLLAFWRSGLTPPLAGFFAQFKELQLKGFKKLD